MEAGFGTGPEWDPIMDLEVDIMDKKENREKYHRYTELLQDEGAEQVEPGWTS